MKDFNKKLMIDKLKPSFTPSRLPHREKELSLLSQLLGLLLKPKSFSRILLITGSKGTGKTVTVNLLLKLLFEAAIKRDIQIKLLNFNCDADFSLEEFLTERLPIIKGDLVNKFQPLFIVLGGLDINIKRNKESMNLLIKCNDNEVKKVLIIGIMKDHSSFLKNAGLSKNILNFNDYSKKEIFEILKYRARLDKGESFFSEEKIREFSEITYENNGDITIGLGLMSRHLRTSK